MSELDDLLAACAAAPEDDAPRLVWADAVGGERGEFVVIQCRLAREELPPAERGALLRRHDELVESFGVAWSGFAGVKGAMSCLFRRGFVECVELDAQVLHISRVLERAPLASSLSLHANRTFDYRDADPTGGTPDPLVTLENLLRDPALQRLRGLELHALVYEITGDTEWNFHSTSVADQVAQLVASTGALAGFRALAIRDELSARGFHELIGSNVLANLERIRFQYGEPGVDQIVEMFAAMANVRAIDDFAALPWADIAGVIPASVVELRGLFRAAGFEALAGSAVAPGIERLGFSGLGPVPPPALGRFPRLRALEYHGTTDGNQRDGGAAQRAAVAAFAQLPLPALSELRLIGSLRADDVLAIVEAFGPQLARLDLSAHDDLPLDEVRAKVAGYVSTPRFRSDTERLLHVGVDTREPWLCNDPIKLAR